MFQQVPSDEVVSNFFTDLLFRVGYNLYKTTTLATVQKTIYAIICASISKRNQPALNLTQEVQYLLKQHLNDEKKLVIIVGLISILFAGGEADFEDYYIVRNVTNPNLAEMIIEMGAPVEKLSPIMQKDLCRFADIAKFIDTIEVD